MYFKAQQVSKLDTMQAEDFTALRSTKLIEAERNEQLRSLSNYLIQYYSREDLPGQAPKLKFASDFVWLQVGLHLEKTLLANPYPTDALHYGYHALITLTNGGIFRVRLHDSAAPTWLHLPKGISQTEFDKSSGQHDRFIKRVKALESSSAPDYSLQRVMVFPSSRTQPAVDFADARDRVYQVTISETHSVLFEKLGQFIHPSSNGGTLACFCVSPTYKVRLDRRFGKTDQELHDRIQLHHLHLPFRRLAVGKLFRVVHWLHLTSRFVVRPSVFEES